MIIYKDENMERSCKETCRAAKKSGKPAILTNILPEAKKEWDQIKKNLGLPK